MITLLCVFLGGLGSSILLTPLIRQWAIRLGLVDRPDNRRKIHGRPIEVAGGFSIFLSLSLVLGVGFLFQDWYQEPWKIGFAQWVGLFLGSLVICLVGIADDFGLIRSRHKLLGQLVAASIVISSGIIVENITFLGWPIDLGLLSIPFTLFFLLGAINSLNLIDGMDGMLGSVAFIVSITIAGMSVFGGHWGEALIAMALAGAVLGFLRYNFPPACIFLGDAGSMMIGLIVGTLAILSSLKASATIVLSTPFVLLTLPFFDTTAAIIRRKLTGRSIYATDRGHLHHCLLRRGYSTIRVLAIVSVCCLVTGIGALASHALNSEPIAFLTGIAVITLLILTRLFGHAEAVLVKQRLVSLGSSLFKYKKLGQAQQLEVRLQGSVEWKKLWSVLSEHAQELNLRQLRLDVNAPALHEGYHARWEIPNKENEFSNMWRIEIPVVTQGIDVGRLLIAGPIDPEPVWWKLESISKVIDEYTNAILHDGALQIEQGLTPVPTTKEEQVPSETSPAVTAATATASEVLT